MSIFPESKVERQTLVSTSKGKSCREIIESDWENMSEAHCHWQLLTCACPLLALVLYHHSIANVIKSIDTQIQITNNDKNIQSQE